MKTHSRKKTSQRLQLEACLLSASTLPSQHLVLLLAAERIQDQAAGAKEVAEILRLDPSIALRCLRTAGSAAFGGHPPSSLLQAIMRIGLDTIGEMVTVALKLRRHACLSLAGRGIFNDLWTHSVLTALAARELTRRRGIASREVQGRAFLLGLIHDAGRLALLNSEPELYEQVVQGAAQGHLGHPVRERRVFGLSHVELGGRLAESWNLGEEAIWVLGAHHQPGRAPASLRAPALIQLADWVAVRIQEGWHLDWGEPDRSSLHQLRLHPSDLRLARVPVAREWDRIQSCLAEAAPLQQVRE